MRSPALSPLKINSIVALPRVSVSAVVSAVVGAVVGACPSTVAVTITPLVVTGLFEMSRKPITGDCVRDHVPAVLLPSGEEGAVSTLSCVTPPNLSVTVLSDTFVTPPADVKPNLYSPVKPLMPRPSNVATP